MAFSNSWSCVDGSMSEGLAVDLFMEDAAHEKLLVPLVERIASEEGVGVRCQVRTARGGHPQVMSELEFFLRNRKHLGLGSSLDMIIVAKDSNCSSFAQTRSGIEDSVGQEYRHLLVAACPDPHIERWYMADVNSFYDVVGDRPDLGSGKCERNYYKAVLGTAVRRGGHPRMLDGIEFGTEIAEKMELYRAGRTERSLKVFVEDLRNKFRTRIQAP